MSITLQVRMRGLCVASERELPASDHGGNWARRRRNRTEERDRMMGGDGSGCGCTGCRTDDDCILEVVALPEALRSPLPLVALGAHALTVATASMPVDGGGWHLLDRRGRLRSTVAYEPDPWPWPADEALREYAVRYRTLDPFVVTAGSRPLPPVMTTQDVVPDFTRHPFARRFLSRIGMRHLAVVNVTRQGQPAAQLWLGRRVGRSEFISAERALLRRLHGLLGMALQHLQAAAGEIPLLADVVERLTRRELEVARIAATGATNAEIAEALTVTRATVATHLHRILNKLGLRGRTELAQLMLQRPTGTQPPPDDRAR